MTEISFDLMGMYCIPNLEVIPVQQILPSKYPTVFKDLLNKTSSDSKLSCNCMIMKKYGYALPVYFFTHSRIMPINFATVHL